MRSRSLFAGNRSDYQIPIFFFLTPRMIDISRSNDLIEPMLMPQWFVKCDQMAKTAIEVSCRWKRIDFYEPDLSSQRVLY